MTTLTKIFLSAICSCTLASCRQLVQTKPENIQPHPRHLVINEVKKTEPLRDIDGNTYKTVQIGSQIWMAENLRVTRYANGDEIRHLCGSTGQQLSKDTLGTWSYVNDDPTLDTVYGKLYNWYAINDSRRIAPAGWRVPTEADWLQLINFAKNNYESVSNSGALSLMANNSLWYNNEYYSGNCPTRSGLNIIPAGESHYQDGKMEFNYQRNEAYIWSATGSNTGHAKYFGIEWRGTFTSSDDLNYDFKIYGMSCRLIKNNEN